MTIRYLVSDDATPILGSPHQVILDLWLFLCGKSEGVRFFCVEMTWNDPIIIQSVWKFMVCMDRRLQCTTTELYKP